MSSQSRKSEISAELSAEKAQARPPFRYDRLLVFLLMLAASALILSQALLERREERSAGQVMDEEVYAPMGFVYYDTPAAEARWRSEFEKMPAPYVFDLAGFDDSTKKLRKFLLPDQSESSSARLFIADPRRRAVALRMVDDLIARARTGGLLEKSYETEHMLSIRDRDGAVRELSSARVLQPGHWEAHLQGLTDDEMIRVSGLLDKNLPPTLRFDEARAREIFAELKKKYPVEALRFAPEKPVIMAGQELDARQAEMLRQLARFTVERNTLSVIALIGFLALTYLFAALYMKRFLPQMYEKLRDVAAVSFAIGIVMLVSLVVRILIGFNLGVLRLSSGAMPVAAAAMLLTLLYGARPAIVFSSFAVILISVVGAPRVDHLVMFLFGGVAGALSAADARRRSDLIKSGLLVAVVQVTVVVLLGMLRGEPVVSIRTDMLSAVLSGLLSAVIVQALLLPLEAISHRISNFSLLELGDLNHPLLQALLRKAPGTFQHSQHVALLAQAAAEAIGANPLLARVGAYFHDIGKMRKPEYFTENQAPGENPHDKLKPSLSAAVIKAHVLDGIIMAQEEKLPEAVIDFIAQHHGTGVMSIFYHRALETVGEEIDVNRGDYQYPGPKPQIPETGIMMLADRVEATSRAMMKPTANRIERMVKKTIADVFESGELDECELTLKDLTIIADRFTHVLCGIYHTRRVEYPEQEEIAEAEKKKREG